MDAASLLDVVFMVFAKLAADATSGVVATDDGHYSAAACPNRAELRGLVTLALDDGCGEAVMALHEAGVYFSHAQFACARALLES